MASEKAVEALGGFLTRRRFLHRVGGAALGGLMLLMGLPQSARGNVWCLCCELVGDTCHNEASDCQPCNCPYTWYCVYNGVTYQCNDCACAPVCGWFTRTGMSPSAASPQGGSLA